MVSPLRYFALARMRRQIVATMVAAILLAALAQAAHFHKDELVRVGSTDVHCLLCQYAGGTAPLPALPQLPAFGVAARDLSASPVLPGPTAALPASYDARGPPRV
jgi:hypothetical protein